MSVQDLGASSGFRRPFLKFHSVVITLLGFQAIVGSFVLSKYRACYQPAELNREDRIHILLYLPRKTFHVLNKRFMIQMKCYCVDVSGDTK